MNTEVKDALYTLLTWVVCVVLMALLLYEDTMGALPWYVSDILNVSSSVGYIELFVALFVIRLIIEIIDNFSKYMFKKINVLIVEHIKLRRIHNFK